MGVDRESRRAVVLDRDSVINRAVVRDGKPYPPARVDELEVLPGVAAALERLKTAGYLLIVVTNQPDVARGTQSRAEVEAIHTRLASILPIDEFRTCYHDDDDACACRKPKPGLILDSARAHGVNLHASVMVGDRWRDVEAGEQAGCATVFLDYEYDERKPRKPDAVFGSLAQAAEWILSRRTRTSNEAC
ncbi:MAG: HAD family hydrolase [Acidobacteria bacterium]|nr:MAG: HAD family hydrolase [Acidobacteriota bacterium]